MKYEKGQTGNPTGRPKGKRNKPTPQALLKEILSDKEGRLQEDIKAASPSERVGLLSSLLNYERRVSGMDTFRDGDIERLHLTTEEEVRKRYVAMMKGKKLNPSEVDEELHKLRDEILS